VQEDDLAAEQQRAKKYEAAIKQVCQSLTDRPFALFVSDL
jgi:hypothetical protein